MTNIYIKDKYLVLGALGILINLFATTQNTPQLYYVIGAVVLLATAIHYKLTYFIALELILIAGHTAIIFGSGSYTQFALPVLLSIQLLVYYLMLGRENTIFLFMGICGIALLSIGLAYNDPKLFCAGSIFIAMYSYHKALNGCYPAFIWAILNTIYIFYNLYRIFW